MTGTDPSYETFFRAEYPKMVALALGVTGDREVAAELAQEGLLRAFRAWGEVAGLERPGAWLRRVVTNLAIDERRRRSRRLPARADLGVASVDPVEPEADDWLRAVRSLPDRQRAVIALHHVDGLPIAEVAEVLGIAPGTVKSSLDKARRKLARRLEGANR